MNSSGDKITIDPVALREGCIRGLRAVLAAIEVEAFDTVPVADGVGGNLQNRLSYFVEEDKLQGIVENDAPYSLWVHEGTGLYGPRQERIYPTRKDALWWPGLDHPVKSTKGMKGRPFFIEAMKNVDMGDEFAKGFNNATS